MTTDPRASHPLPHWLDGGPAALSERLAAHGQPSWRGRQLLEAFRKHANAPAPQLSTWPKALVAEFFAAARWQWYERAEHLVDPDGTQKWVLTLGDGARIQCVMIPDQDRRTLCISSQVGCAMACSFCSTGDMGFGRNLSAGEIVGQWLLVDHALRAAGDRGLSHVVFMGMGEPLHNLDAVLQAIAWLNDPAALAQSPTRLTVSTVGLRQGLERLLGETRVNLAVSLHAADPDVRRTIVPAERGMPAAELGALLRAHRGDFGPQRKLTLEVVVISGLNDRPRDAEALIAWAKGLPVRVNLIPFNPYPGGRYERPGNGRVLDFQRRLRRAGLQTLIRRTRGERIQAACGTLNTQAPERMHG